MVRLCLAGAVAALLLIGCSKRSEPDDAGAAATSASARGLRLELPQGWTADVDPRDEDELLVGPPGRPVLRIAHSPSGSKLPSSEDLAAVFTSELGGAQVRTLGSEDADQGSLWIARIDPAKEDVPGWDVALGARRVRGEVLLCATLPGAREDEVRTAAELCSSLR